MSLLSLHLTKLPLWNFNNKPKDSSVIEEKFHTMFTMNELFWTKGRMAPSPQFTPLLNVKIFLYTMAKFYVEMGIKVFRLSDESKRSEALLFFEILALRVHPDGSPLFEVQYLCSKKSDKPSVLMETMNIMKSYDMPYSTETVGNFASFSAEEHDIFLSYLEETSYMLSSEYKIEFESSDVKKMKPLFRRAFICSNLVGLISVEPGEMTKPVNCCATCAARNARNKCAGCKALFYCNQV